MPETEVQDTAPSSEEAATEAPEAPEVQESPEPSERSSRDDGLAERLRLVEAQARFFQEEYEKTRRETDALRAAQRPDPREEQARLEAMDPEQRITYIFEKSQADSKNQIAMVEARSTSQFDRLQFNAELSKVASDFGWSSAKRTQMDQEVEQWYNAIARDALRNGQPMLVTRVDLLDKKMGQEMRTSGAKALRGASDKGKANIAKQSAKMTPASSNVTGKSTGKTKAQESIERMLAAGVLEM